MVRVAACARAVVSVLARCADIPIMTHVDAVDAVDAPEADEDIAAAGITAIGQIFDQGMALLDSAVDQWSRELRAMLDAWEPLPDGAAARQVAPSVVAQAP